MKALLCTQFGPPEPLEVADVPPPVAGPGEVVICREGGERSTSPTC